MLRTCQTYQFSPEDNKEPIIGWIAQYMCILLFLQDEASITIDSELEHHSSLVNAHKNIDDMTDQGMLTLQNIREQRGVLKVSGGL